MTMTTKRPPLDFDAIKIAAHGNWVNTIFPAVGIHFDKNHKKHQPCPTCGGNDRFRCDDKGGNGTWICSHCGSGDGFKLVELYTHTSDSYDLMKLIGGIMGVSATSSITPEQRQKWLDDINAKKQTEALAEKQAHDKTAQYAVNRWNKASMTGNSDYCQRKQIFPYFARFEPDCLLVPVVKYDPVTDQQFIRNLQRIFNNGDKRFLKDSEKSYCYCPLGTDDQFVNPPVVLIVEGYATGASVYHAMGQSVPVVVAFDTGNLIHAGGVMRGRFPNARIIFCADDDSHLPKNAGIESAKEASHAVQGEVIIPDFSIINNNNKAVA